MVRHRLHYEILYGHMGEVLELADEIRRLAEDRGWIAPTHWWPVVGRGNVIIAETDYPTLKAFEQQSSAMLTDPDYMKLFRRISDVAVQGSVQDELVEPTAKIA